MSIGLYAIIIIFTGITTYIIYTYNRLIKLRNRVNESYSDLDVQIKRRYDLLPLLESVVSAAIKHERDLLKSLAEIKSIANNKTDSEQIEYSIKTVFARMEKYPQIKTNSNFLELTEEAKNIETRILAARKFYNSNVKAYNNKVESFPSNIIAKFASFEKYFFFNN